VREEEGGALRAGHVLNMNFTISDTLLTHLIYFRKLLKNYRNLLLVVGNIQSEPQILAHLCH